MHRKKMYVTLAVVTVLLAGCKAAPLPGEEVRIQTEKVPAAGTIPKLWEKTEDAAATVAADKPEGTDSAEAADKPESTDSAEAVDKPESTDPAEAADKPESTDPAEAADKPGRADSAEAADKLKGADPAEAADKPESTDPAEAADKLKGADPAEAADKLKGADLAEAADKPESADPAEAADKPESADPAEAADKLERADTAELAAAVFRLINGQRTEAGLSELVWENTLAEAAQIRAEELAVKFSHTRPDGSQGSDIAGAVCSGENLASTAGSLSTAAHVAEQWKQSGMHRDNMLCADFTRAGAAVYETAEGRMYWVVIFAGD